MIDAFVNTKASKQTQAERDISGSSESRAVDTVKDEVTVLMLVDHGSSGDDRCCFFGLQEL